jgi:L-ribulokinase
VNGGYDTILEAAAKMTRIKQVYTPKPESVVRYAQIYDEYRILHDYFGRGANDVMKRLKEIKLNARA